ncbi:hypothetical protein RJD39_13730 [Vibrio scophthalmi]|nr:MULTISPECIES: hypothetical protein [Vibrio]MCY9805175.1 hypothetical protein [Vibrio scophthalmi]
MLMLSQCNKVLKITNIHYLNPVQIDLIGINYQNHSIKRLELSKVFYNNGLNKTKQSGKKD